MNEISVNSKLDMAFDKIPGFCKRWNITEFSLFGSVLRDDFRPDSDIDVLVTFDVQARWSLFDLVKMQEELSQLLHRKVDLVEREAITLSPNYIRRKNILQSAKVIYATR